MPGSEQISDRFTDPDMSQSNLLQLAQQGDAGAIAVLMNRHLYPNGISAEVEIKDSCLCVVFEAQTVPEQQALVEFLYQGVLDLNVKGIAVIWACGREIGAETAAWTQEIALLTPPGLIRSSSLPGVIADFTPPASEQLPAEALTLPSYAGYPSNTTIASQFPGGVIALPPTVKTLAAILTFVALGISWLVYQYLIDPNAQPPQIRLEKKSLASPQAKKADPLDEPVPSSRVTRAKYDRVENGMSYEKVVVILGNAGDPVSTNQLIGAMTVMYVWRNADGSSMNAMFENGKLIQKAQFDLK